MNDLLSYKSCLSVERPRKFGGKSNNKKNKKRKKETSAVK